MWELGKEQRSHDKLGSRIGEKTKSKKPQKKKRGVEGRPKKERNATPAQYLPGGISAGPPRMESKFQFLPW